MKATIKLVDFFNGIDGSIEDRLTGETIRAMFEAAGRAVADSARGEGRGVVVVGETRVTAAYSRRTEAAGGSRIFEYDFEFEIVEGCGAGAEPRELPAPAETA